MATMLGADPDLLDRLSSALSAAAQELRTLEARVGAAVQQSPWHGLDAEGFRAEWVSREALLVIAAATQLESTATAVTRNATEQRQASAADGGGIAGPARGDAVAPRARQGDGTGGLNIVAAQLGDDDGFGDDTLDDDGLIVDDGDGIFEIAPSGGDDGKPPPTPPHVSTPGPLDGPLEGARGVDVYDPVTGDRITDIDRIEQGHLVEEKSATMVLDPEIWVYENVEGKIDDYLDARRLLPGYEDAPIVLDFTTPGVDPGFRDLVEAEIARQQELHPDVDISVRWAD